MTYGRKRGERVAGILIDVPFRDLLLCVPRAPCAPRDFIIRYFRRLGGGRGSIEITEEPSSREYLANRVGLLASQDKLSILASSGF